LVFVGKALKPFVVEDTLLKSCTNKRDYDKKKNNKKFNRKKDSNYQPIKKLAKILFSRWNFIE
jgi:hypothetical protein